jgi:hypothetical protein
MRLPRPVVRGTAALAFLAVLATSAVPVAAAAATTETYTMGGYEVFYAPDHAVFVGTGSGSGGPLELSGWYTSVYHSLVVVPSGEVTGGSAVLQRIDGVQIRGDILSGEAVQTNPGANCTTETHAVTAILDNVTRSDTPGKTGTAVLMATLTHYHVWVFGTCYAYSARVDGSITVIV